MGLAVCENRTKVTNNHKSTKEVLMFIRQSLIKVVGVLLVVSLVASLSVTVLAYGPEEPITPAGKSVWPRKFPNAPPSAIQGESIYRKNLERPVEIVVPAGGTEAYMELATLIFDCDVGGTATGVIRMMSFHTAYPQVRAIPALKYPGGTDGTNKLMADLAGGTAYAYYNIQLLGGAQTAASKGLVADITEYVENWPFKKYLPQKVLDDMTFNGRYYAFPSNAGGYEKGLWFRTDWFKEAGLFNDEGYPEPPTDWTVTDFRAIAQKLTDPKRDRWGLAISFEDKPKGGGFYNMWSDYTWGIPVVLPDPTGNNTYISGVDTPVSIRALEFEHDLIYKYKCAIGGVSWHQADLVKENRAAMSCGYDAPSGVARHSAIPVFQGLAERDGKEVSLPYREIIGAAPFPKGPQGVRLSSVQGAKKYWGFNPTLDEEQLLAAFQYLSFYECLFAYSLGVLTDSVIVWRDLYLSDDPYKLPAALPEFQFLAPHFYPVKGTIPWLEEAAKHNPSAARARGAILADPTLPSILSFGGYVLNETEAEAFMRKCAIEVLSQENPDIPKITAKYAKMISSDTLAYKEEAISKEVLKNYYTALGEFWKKNFPAYYENVWTKELWEGIQVW